MIKIPTCRIAVIQDFANVSSKSDIERDIERTFSAVIRPIASIKEITVIQISGLGVDIDVIAAITSPMVNLVCDVGLRRPVNSNTPKITRPCVFIAEPPHSQFPVGDGHFIGIVPAGSKVDDLVCSFLESRVTLVMRPHHDEHKPSDMACYDSHGLIQHVKRSNNNNNNNNKPSDPNNEPHNVTTCGLVGRASIFNVNLPSNQEKFLDGAKEYSLASRPKIDKSAEVIQTAVDNPPSLSWPGMLSIDLPTLQLLHGVGLLNKQRGFGELNDLIYWFGRSLDKIFRLV